MLRKKLSRLLVAAIALIISTTIATTTLKVYATSVLSTEIEQIDTDTLLLDAQQMAEAFNIQISEPRLIEYTVKSGDTVESIAITYAINISTITLSNGIEKDSELNDGQKLVFPSIDGTAHKIKDGETLWDLASAYKIDFDDLLAINNLSSPDKLKLGQQIILPDVQSLKTQTQAEPKKASAKPSAAKPASSSSTSKGRWPVSGPVTSKFGKRWGRMHEGIDIGVSTGTTVRAFMSGKVTYSSWESGYGYLVKISHGNGLESLYGHNSKLLVKVGQTVSAGDVISKSGNTGESTGPHVHFEVRKNGNPVNPYSYLR